MAARDLGFLLAAILLLGAAPGAAQDREAKRLKPGVFLYAAPDLLAPHFTQAVVLLVRHEQEGSLGVIINRPTRTPVGEALRELGPARDLDLAVYFGGPVQPEAMLALVRSPRPVDAATRVLPDVYFCTDLGPVKELARRPDAASRLRIYAGYAGWGPGQLAGELRRGSWIVAPADARAVFVSDPSAVWPRIYGLLKRIEAAVTGPVTLAPGRQPAGGRRPPTHRARDRSHARP